MYAVQVVAIRFRTIKLYEFFAENILGEPLEAGASIGQAIDAVKDPGNRVLFLFPDFRSNITNCSNLSSAAARYLSPAAFLRTILSSNNATSFITGSSERNPAARFL